ncbi:MAG: MgtC/SapB family protein [Nanoarchaeota archaeon]
MEYLVIILRFLIVFSISLVFGIQRQMSNKPTGFGAFVFVASGSCALGIIATMLNHENPTPLLAAIVTGIGFLGAGALIKTTDKIFGFTTAAGIWIFAIIGLIIGVGEYFIGLLTYSIIWLVVIIDGLLELRGIGAYQRRISINTNKIIDKSEILKIFGRRKWKLVDLNIDKKKKKSSMKYLLTIPREEVGRIRDELYKQKWVESFRIE